MEYQLIASSIPQELSAVERVLTNRGIPLNQIEHYLHTTDDDILDPTLISNITDGARMLIKHIAQKDKVLIQVDSDCDGFTSSAVLINYLNCLFPAFVQNNILYRIHTGKQHGLIPKTVEDNIKLVILPDASG
jgi:single-stranded-DNA-specific exonuclease